MVAIKNKDLGKLLDSAINGLNNLLLKIKNLYDINNMHVCKKYRLFFDHIVMKLMARTVAFRAENIKFS